MLHNFVAMCWWFPWVMSHVWMSEITTYLCGTENRERNSMWVLSLHISGAGDSPASCHTFDWVMSHVWMSHVTRINESFYMCDIKRYVVIGPHNFISTVCQSYVVLLHLPPHIFEDHPSLIYNRTQRYVVAHTIGPHISVLQYPSKKNKKNMWWHM